MRPHLLPTVKPPTLHYFPVYEIAILDTKLRRADLAVLGLLASFWHTTTEAFPSKTTIAKRTGYKRTQVADALRNLRRLGYIHRHQCPRIDNPDASSSNVYTPGPTLTQPPPKPENNLHEKTIHQILYAPTKGGSTE